MEIFERTFQVAQTDADSRGLLRLQALFALQERAALDHAAACGFGMDRTFARGLLWIIALQQARITRLPASGETVHLHTWPGPWRHVLAPRFSRLTDEHGGLLVESSALWGLMDAETRSLVPPAKHGIVLPETVTGLEPPLPRPIRRLAPSQQARWTVPPEALDQNGHVNNTRYVALAESLLPPARRAQTPLCVRAEYAGEALLGQTLALSVAETAQTFFVSGTQADGGQRVFRVEFSYVDD